MNSSVSELLSSGYLRETEQEFNVYIADVIKSKIHWHFINIYIQYQLFAHGGNDMLQLGISSRNIDTFIEVKSIPETPFRLENIYCNSFNLSIINAHHDIYFCGGNYNYIKNHPMTIKHFIKMDTEAEFEQNEVPILMSKGTFNQEHIFIYTSLNNIYFSGEKYDPATQERSVSILSNTSNIPNIIDIHCGQHHTLFLTTNGNVYSWGHNWVGQCGISTDEKQKCYIEYPEMIETQNIIKIMCSKETSFMINKSNQLISFGQLLVCGMSPNSIINTYKSPNNKFNEFQSYIDTPIINKYFDENNIKICMISAGGSHAVCVDSEGNVYTFGYNYNGIIGNGICYIDNPNEEDENEILFQYEPYKVQIPVPIVDIATGFDFNVLLTDTNELITFGYNAGNVCSVLCDQEYISLPYLASKEEFGIAKHSFIEKMFVATDSIVICIDPDKHIDHVLPSVNEHGQHQFVTNKKGTSEYDKICVKCSLFGDIRILKYNNYKCHTSPVMSHVNGSLIGFHREDLESYHPNEDLKSYHPGTTIWIHKEWSIHYHPKPLIEKVVEDTSKPNNIEYSHPGKYITVVTDSFCCTKTTINKWDCCDKENFEAIGCYQRILKNYKTIEIYPCCNTMKKGCCMKYLCCDGAMTSKGCCMVYDCCRDDCIEGCKNIYACCGLDIETDGCQKRYHCCDKDITFDGCLKKWNCCNQEESHKGCKIICSTCDVKWGHKEGCTSYNHEESKHCYDESANNVVQFEHDIVHNNLVMLRYLMNQTFL
eukprot:517178_1